MSSNSKGYPDLKQADDERWIAPLPDDQKHTVKVAPCLGCGRLPHADELNCLRRRVQTLTRERDRDVERCAEIAYRVNAEGTFGVAPRFLPKRDGESGSPVQTHAVEWKQLPEFFREKWRRIVRAIL
jgi:hypothetical protein